VLSAYARQPKRDHNPKKMKITGFLREIAIVVIGVLIAVWINNWQQSSANQKYIQQTLAAIENEIQQNSSDIDTVLAKHRKIIAYLEEHYDNTEETIGDMLIQLGGIQSPEIKNIGLRFFIANKAELVSYDVIAHLSAIETNKEVLTRKMERLIDFAYDHINATDLDTKIKFAYYLSNVMDTEQALLELYADDIPNNKSARAER
jgi:cytoskeletal protein RodZ